MGRIQRFLYLAASLLVAAPALADWSEVSDDQLVWASDQTIIRHEWTSTATDSSAYDISACTGKVEARFNPSVSDASTDASWEPRLCVNSTDTWQRCRALPWDGPGDGSTWVPINALTQGENYVIAHALTPTAGGDTARVEVRCTTAESMVENSGGGGSGLESVEEDLTPALGGDLDANGNNVENVGDLDAEDIDSQIIGDVYYCDQYAGADLWEQCQAAFAAAVTANARAVILQLPRGSHSVTSTTLDLCDDRSGTLNYGVTVRGHGSATAQGGTRVTFASGFETTAVAATFTFGNDGTRDYIDRPSGSWLDDGYKRGDLIETTGFSTAANNYPRTGGTENESEHLKVYRATATRLTVESENAVATTLPSSGDEAGNVRRLQAGIEGCASGFYVRDVTFVTDATANYADILVHSRPDITPVLACSASGVPYALCSGAGTTSGTMSSTGGVNGGVSNVYGFGGRFGVALTALEASGQADHFKVTDSHFHSNRVGIYYDSLQAQPGIKVTDTQMEAFTKNGFRLASGSAILDDTTIISSATGCVNDTYGACNHVYMGYENVEALILKGRSFIEVKGGGGIAVADGGSAESQRRFLSLGASRIVANTTGETDIALVDAADACLTVQMDGTRFTSGDDPTNAPTITFGNSSQADCPTKITGTYARTNTGAAGSCSGGCTPVVTFNDDIPTSVYSDYGDFSVGQLFLPTLSDCSTESGAGQACVDSDDGSLWIEGAELVGGGGFDSTAVDATTWSDGANASNTWTFDVSGTDHTMVAGNGVMTFGDSVTVTDVLSTPTLTLTGTGTLNGLDAIDSTTETTLEAALEATSLQGFASNMATFLGTASSANLLATVSDETGTGVLVFGTSPTIATANLTGAIDWNDVAVNDDDCTGQQGEMWYDSTDAAFEVCNANSGAPVTISSGVADGDKGDVTVGSAGTSWTIDADTIGASELDETADVTFNSVTTAPTASPAVTLEDSESPDDTDDDNDAAIISADMTDATGDSTDSKAEISVQVADTVTEVAQFDGSGITTPFTLITGVGLDAVGAVDMDYGSADVTDHTFTTDGTGDGEIVLPATSIGDSEIGSVGLAKVTGLGTGVGTVLATPSSANLASAITDETGSGVAVFGTSPVFTTNADIVSDGVRLSSTQNGTLTLLGLGDGSDENLTINLDDTANTVALSSSTGVSLISMPGISLTATTGYIRGSQLVGSSTGGALVINAVTLATAAGDYDIPDNCDSASGAWVEVWVQDASETVSITTVDTGDTFVVNGIGTLVANDELDSDGTAGGHIRLTCVANGFWYASDRVGTWTDGGAAD